MQFIYRYRKWLIVLLTALLTAGLIPVLSRFSVADVLALARGSVVGAALILAALYVIKSVVIFIPLLALYIGAGLVFPLPLAIFLSMVYLTLEMTLCYYNGKAIGKKRFGAMIEKSPKMARFVQFNTDNSSTTCFLSRISPLTFDLCSMFFGASGMPYRRYLFFSLLGECPKMIPYIIAGRAIDSPLSREFLLPFAAGIGVSLILFFLSRYMMKKKDACRQA